MPRKSNRFSVNNLSVRALLWQAAIGVVLGNLAILVAYIVSGQLEKAAIDSSQHASEIRQQVDIVSSDFNRLATLEERLLRTKDLELLEQHKAVYDAVEGHLVKLVSMIPDGDELGAIASAMGDVLSSYDDRFAKFIDQQKVVGLSLDAGLLGALEAASDAMEVEIGATDDKRIQLIYRRIKSAERGYRRSADPGFLTSFEKTHERLLQIADRAEVSESFKPSAQNHLTAMQSLVRENGVLLADLAEVQRVSAQLPPLIGQIRAETSSNAASAAEAAATTRQWSGIVVIALVLVIGVLMVLGALWLIRRIAPPLASAVETCQEISGGNLTLNMASERHDEIGQLLNALNEMSSRLTEVVTDVHDTAETILQGAGEISSSTDYLSQRTEQSAASLEKTAASMDEMTATVTQNAENARQAADLADLARAKASSGGDVVGRAIDAMEEINVSSKRVESVISVVDGIAFQTNLLALNAAVEAARAGESGRGFAVVASEVRTLAQRSAESASEVKQLIGESLSKVHSGQKLVNESGELLREIVAEIQRVATIVAEISVATQEQAEGIRQVNDAVLDMDQVTQQNAAMVEEAASASAQMEQKARELTARVDYFKLAASTQGYSISPAPSRYEYPQDTQAYSTPAVRHAATQAASALPDPSASPASTSSTDSWEEF